MTSAERLESFLARIPYVRRLGLRGELTGDKVTGVLPFAPHLVGNIMLPALHGGVVGALLELTALAQLAVSEPNARGHKTVDINIDYLRPARAITTYARADLRKVGRRIASVHVEAWQEDPAQPVAALRGHFLMSGEG
jgi:uncharacterized protein (TIGR00369 family)